MTPVLKYHVNLDRRTAFLAFLLALASVSGVTRTVARVDQLTGLTVLRQPRLFDLLLSVIQVTASTAAAIGVFLARPWGWWLGVSYWLSELARSGFLVVIVLSRTAGHSTAAVLRDVVYVVGILAAEAWVMRYFFEKGLDQALGMSLSLRPRQWLGLCGTVSGAIGLVYVLSIAFGY